MSWRATSQMLALAGALVWADVAHAADGVGWRQDGGGPTRSASRNWDSAQRFQGRIVWQANIGNLACMSPVVAPDGTIYVTTRTKQRALVAINETDGTEKWAVPLQNLSVSNKPFFAYQPPAIFADGSLIVAGNRVDFVPRLRPRTRPRTMIFRLRSEDGSVLQSTQRFRGMTISSPLWVSDDEQYVVVSIKETTNPDWPTLLRLNASLSHSEAGHLPFGDYATDFDIHISRTIATLGLYLIYYGVRYDFDRLGIEDLTREFLNAGAAYDPISRHIIMVGAGAVKVRGDGATNNEHWTRKRESARSTITTAIASSAFVTGNPDGGISLYKRDGVRNWLVNIGSEPTGAAAINLRDDQLTVFVSGTNGTLYAMRDSNLLWKQVIEDGGCCLSSPVVLGGITPAQDRVIIVGETGLLHALDMFGLPRANPVRLDGPSLGTPAVIRGRVYVVTENSLFALE